MSCLELDDNEVLNIADPMMDDVIRGLLQRDYALHSCHFSVTLKSQIGPEEFLANADHYESNWGRPGGRELACIFRKEKSFTVVWHQQFSNTNAQVMGVVTVAIKGGRYFVDYLLLH